METTIKAPKVKKHSRLTLSVKDYKKSENFDGNRPANIQHVLEMAESVKRNGQTRDVIMVNLKGEPKLLRIDGNHLFEALKLLRLPVDYRIVECKDREEVVRLMIDMNNTSRGWKIPEFIDAWAWFGKADYKFLKKAFVEQMTVLKQVTQDTVLLMAYAQDANRGVVTKSVKLGTFKIKNMKIANQLIQQISDCNKFIKPSRPANQALITMMLEEGVDYNHKKMLKNLAISPLTKEANSEKNEGKIKVHLKDILRGI